MPHCQKDGWRRMAKIRRIRRTWQNSVCRWSIDKAGIRIWIKYGKYFCVRMWILDVEENPACILSSPIFPVYFLWRLTPRKTFENVLKRRATPPHSDLTINQLILISARLGLKHSLLSHFSARSFEVQNARRQLIFHV